MNYPHADCTELTRKTAEAINNEVLEQLFAVVQQNNVDVSVHAAMKL